MAMLVTQIAAAGAALAWMFAEWATKGKPSVLGVISGAVAGLVAITPASGFVLPGPALLIGVVAGLSGFWGATALKHMCGYDDSLDAFGVHGICGIVGSLMVGFLAYGPLSATTGGYLDDLFVDPQMRGKRVADALIAAIAEEGRRRGWSVIRWITAEDNHRARATYDRVAKLTPWRTYDIPL